MSTADLIVSNFCNNPKKKEIHDPNIDQTSLARVQAVAFQELKEDEYTREQCLKQFREWILQNRDIENCITDDSFLLRFLRVKKYSLYMAQQMLLKYLNFRKRFDYIFNNLDYLEPNVYEIITSGYIIASPFRDKYGRRVIIVTARRFDTKFSSTDMARAHMITFETLMDDEENQILGFTHVGDCANASPSILSKWSVSEFITLVKWGQHSIPMRHKQIHVMNVPFALMYVYDLISSLGSQKLRDRASVYNNFEQLHSNVDPCVLPDEYGGKMPMNEMIDLWTKELAAKRDRLLSLDKMNLLSDQGIVRSRTKTVPINTASITGSFRKLQID